MGNGMIQRIAWVPILALIAMTTLIGPGAAQNFGNIPPQTVIGNPSMTVKQPAEPMPLSTVNMTVPTNAALVAAATTSYQSGVWRLGFTTQGDAPPLFYKASNSPCSLNAGAGDNGSQVRSADNKCWLAVFPTSGIDWRQFGRVCDGSTDQTAILQAAGNAAILAQAPLVLYGNGPATLTACKFTTNPVTFVSPAGGSGAGEITITFVDNVRLYFNAAAGDFLKFDGTVTRWGGVTTTGSPWIEPYNSGTGNAISIYSANHISLGNSLRITNQDTSATFGAGILIDNTFSGILYDPYINGATDGIRVQNATLEIMLLNGEIAHTTSHGYYMVTGGNDFNTILGTYLELNTGEAINCTNGSNLKVRGALFNQNSGAHEINDACPYSQHDALRISNSNVSSFPLFMGGSGQTIRGAVFIAPVTTQTPLRLDAGANNGRYEGFISQANPTACSGVTCYYSDASTAANSQIRGWQGPAGEQISNAPIITAIRGSDQTINDSTFTLVQFNNDTIIQGNRLTTLSAGLFTPHMIGKYDVVCRIGWTTAIPTNKQIVAGIAVNSSTVVGNPTSYGGGINSGAGADGVTVSGVVQTTGINDTIGCLAYQNTGVSAAVNSNSNSTYMTISPVGGQ